MSEVPESGLLHKWRHVALRYVPYRLGTAAMTVSDLLQQSRDAHQRYREALPTRGYMGDPVSARASLVQALDYREQAVSADPELTEPAWAAEASTHDHTALLAFYREQLSR